MKVFRDLSEVDFTEGTVVTTGTFDGVHQGHRQVIKSLTDKAKESGFSSVLLTFYPHPRMVLQQDYNLKLLNSLEEKIELLKETGVDNLVIIPFTKEFSRLSSMSFVREVLVGALNTKKLVIGYDHHFGRNREGSFEHLREFGPVYGFTVDEIPVHQVKELKISSTKIRSFISEGEVALAKELLGYPYSLQGKVVDGLKQGKTLGFPTANLQVMEAHKLVPRRGVYAARVAVENKIFNGMMNIGVKPTFGDHEESIEVHLFDFSGDLYGKEIQVSFMQRIRGEKSFESKDALVEQLEKDKLNIQQLL